jgi:hypothetical protein
LTAIKVLLEVVKERPYSMSEVIGLLCQWSQSSITDLEKTKAKLNELTTKREPPKAFH